MIYFMYTDFNGKDIMDDEAEQEWVDKCALGNYYKTKVAEFYTEVFIVADK